MHRDLQPQLLLIQRIEQEVPQMLQEAATPAVAVHAQAAQALIQEETLVHIQVEVHAVVVLLTPEALAVHQATQPDLVHAAVFQQQVL